jgi:hypothetical protein
LRGQSSRERASGHPRKLRTTHLNTHSQPASDAVAMAVQSSDSPIVKAGVIAQPNRV